MAVNYSVITKLVNSSTMTASDISTDVAFISNTNWLLFIFTCSKDKKRKMIATLVMPSNSGATVLFNWLNKYFNFWD